MQITSLNSPNVNERKDGVKPSYIILHYTGTVTAAEAQAVYMTPDKVSPHYMVDYDGAITAFVPEEMRAWHAGKSCWHGIEDMNSHTVGIEVVNPGHEHGYRAFTAAQMDALVKLCHGIMARHHIPAKNVIGHSDIAPGRKIDPGELLDWPLLAAAGIGVWPHVSGEDYAQADAAHGNERELTALLAQAGYDTRLELPVLIEAFQRHFEPDVFAGKGGEAGVASRETRARLYALIRQT